jgi:hypothetical protein
MNTRDVIGNSTKAGQSTQRIIENRRNAKFITPIPKPKKRKVSTQVGFVFDEGKGLSTKEQQYDPISISNEVRRYVGAWRQLSPRQAPERFADRAANISPAFSRVRARLTIKDRLRVLQPNDPDSYYARREIISNDMLDDMNRAKIVITNFHAFKPRERVELSKGGRQSCKVVLGVN